jgi:hypothetical protein
MTTQVEPTFNFSGDFSHPIALKLKNALNDALNDKHKLSSFILDMEGMSGKIYRKFINNFIGSLDDARYLEVGSLKGSTSCSAMYNNTVQISCIENWHWDYRKQFSENTQSVINEEIKFQLIEKDFRSVDYNSIGKYNVYMFDGPHTSKDQYDGVYCAQPALDQTYVLIVDDWNWHEVQKGTWSAIEHLEHKVISYIDIFTTKDGSYPSIADHYSDWHNGYFIAVLEKKN